MRLLIAAIALAATASAQTVVTPPTNADLQLATDWPLCSGSSTVEGSFGSFVLEAPATAPDTLWLVTHSITPTPPGSSGFNAVVAWYLGDTAFFPPTGSAHMLVTCLESSGTIVGLGSKYMHSSPHGNQNVWAELPRPTDPAIVGMQWYAQPVLMYRPQFGGPSVAAGRGWAITL